MTTGSEQINQLINGPHNNFDTIGRLLKMQNSQEYFIYLFIYLFILMHFSVKEN